MADHSSKRIYESSLAATHGEIFEEVDVEPLGELRLQEAKARLGRHDRMSGDEVEPGFSAVGTFLALSDGFGDVLKGAAHQATG